MKAAELREKYHKFFEERGHKRIPPAPLIPENDPTALFITAGMHPLVPFLLGESHPLGRRLVDVQKCIRTRDIDEVGDSSHLTFFEMLGNWSLGDYFKEESLRWSYEFLTTTLHLDRARLAVTVFAGDSDAPRDDVSAEIWRSLGFSDERIHFLPRTDNWWGPVGNTGPCGPDSEIFFDTGKPDHSGCRPGCPCGKWFEIWNNVFMQYNKKTDGTYEKLIQQNVDTGMGIDRTIAVLGGYGDVFMIDTLYPLIQHIENMSNRQYAENLKPFRVIADHMRASVFAIADGAIPSNVEAGYVVRRLIRRAIRYAHEIGIEQNFGANLAQVVINIFAEVYPELKTRQETIFHEIDREETKFRRTLKTGLREYHKLTEKLRSSGQSIIPAAEAFNLFETFGFPLPFTIELAQEQGFTVDEKEFDLLYREHQEMSRQGAMQKFKGGLADHTAETTRLHTATHLLHQALRQVVGTEVRQKGSNITGERLRFDFASPTKLTPDQISEVENIVNRQIEAKLPVSVEVMPLEQALQSGALAFFGEKYGDQVKVYSIGAFSREVCGGPHVTNTEELGRFKIVKEEAVAQGVRRIRAVLQ